MDKDLFIVSHKHKNNSSVMGRVADSQANDLGSILGKISNFFVNFILLNPSNYTRIMKSVEMTVWPHTCYLTISLTKLNCGQLQCHVVVRTPIARHSECWWTIWNVQGE